ncbi:uncharacterized protein Hap1MRO34_006056 [Clarias gariepinus]
MCQRALWLTSICTSVLFLARTEEQDCYGEQYPNGTTRFHINETLPVSQEYSWQVNGIVEANYESFNNATVKSRGPAYVNFNSCYENVTYWSAHAGKIISCHYDCSPVHLLNGIQPKRLELCLFLFFLLVAGVLGYVLWLKRNNLQKWAQDMREAWCSYYIQAPLGA